jgi:glycine/D-amino acid oxidase-like deaminating enzyme
LAEVDELRRTAVSETADVIVVGAGVIGSSIALELAKQRLKVVVVDKASGPGQGSTSASSAIIRFNYSRWDSVAAAWESKYCWENWLDHLGHQDDAGIASFHRTGMVMLDVPIAPTDRLVGLFERAGVPYERWDAPTLAARVPGIDIGRYWPPKPVHEEAFFDDATGTLGGIYMPDAGFVDDPQLAAQNLAFASQHEGASMLYRRRVVEVLKAGGRISGAMLSDGTQISAPVVVNAAGPWSGKLNELAGVGGDFSVHVRPMRQEVHYVAAAPAAYSEEGRFGPSIADLDLGTYIRAAPGGIYVGGTEPACDPMEWIDDPDESDPRPKGRQFEAQVTRAARRFPALAVPNAPKGIAGVYDVTEDWTPIYDRTDLDGYYVAIGTSGNQFKNAPIVGRMMATLIDGVEHGHDHDQDPVHVVGKHTGLDIGLGTFSRKRALNDDSSGTVMG